MLSAGNVSDVTAAPALLEQAKPMRYLVPTRATTPIGSAIRYVRQVPHRSFLAAATASAPSAMTGAATAAAT